MPGRVKSVVRDEFSQACRIGLIPREHNAAVEGGRPPRVHLNVRLCPPSQETLCPTMCPTSFIYNILLRCTKYPKYSGDLLP